MIYIALVFAFCLLCGNLVSCQIKEEEAPDSSSADISIPAPPAQKPDMEVREERETLEEVDLDGDGLADTVTVVARFDPLLFEEGEEAGAITYKKMFGEYGVYCNGKIFGVICDDQLFIKVTEAGRNLKPDLPLGAPYNGAKPHFLIENIDDRAFMREFVTATCQELPIPKPKKGKKSNGV